MIVAFPLVLGRDGFAIGIISLWQFVIAFVFHTLVCVSPNPSHRWVVIVYVSQRCVLC